MTRPGLGLVLLLLAAGVDRVYEDALAQYRAGDAGAAARALEAALERDGPDAARLTLLGWCRLRTNELDDAEAAFLGARARGAEGAEPSTGLGYIALRRGQNAEALAQFGRAVELAPASADAWKGLGLTRKARGDRRAARDALVRAVELAPSDTEAREALAAIVREPIDERRPHGALSRSVPIAVPVRATPRGFEIEDRTGGRPLFVRGINLSTALPGHDPGEFPDDFALYRRWFDQMGELGVNTVRLYTLHPPSLYRALASHNAERPEARLWLVQGVWSELPPGDDFLDPAFEGDLVADVRRAIDAVHGNLELPPHPGRAWGTYDTDVSRHLLALLIGREWEPYVVDGFDRKHPELRSHDGRYVRAESVRPTEAWLARLLDQTVAHESEWYRTQHPVAFVSWPTLDPLRHETESTWSEEQRLRGKPGIASPGEPPFDDDATELDPTVLHAGTDYVAGLFASYHVYPYHPDFLLLDPTYAPDRYLGYLRALAQRHAGMPVLIAELGVPTSRGNSHVHPEGLDQGGHTEREQGLAILHLLGAVEQAGMAGGIVFSWVDEWFKRNWLTASFESPPERDRLWLNVLDPEECYGLIAARPGARADWSAVAPLMSARPGLALGALRATSDEAFVYLSLEVDRPPGDGREYWIGIDSYDAELGDHRFPAPVDVPSPIGIELLVRLTGRTAGRIDVDRPYDPFDAEGPRPLRSEANSAGAFVAIRPETNRERIGRDGTRYPAVHHDRSVLRYGEDDLADWHTSTDGKRIELRLPWSLLNVADPSSHRVAHEEREQEGPVATVATDGFRFHVLALDRNGSAVVVVARLPDVELPAVSDFPTWRWPAWEVPRYRLEPKHSYFVIQRALRRLAGERNSP